MAERSEHPAERGLSPLNPLDSEVCGGSSYPLSFPSQPPDIKNWFSSYEYESPECSGLAQDLHSFLLPAEEERETQDPLGSSPKKAEVSPAVEDKQLAESPLIIPRGRVLYYGVELQHKSSLVTEFVPLKENQDPLPEVEEKSSGENDGSENAERNLNLSTVNEKLVRDYKRSPKWIPAKTKCRQDVSHQQNSREISPIPPKIDADSEVAHEGELFPRCNIGKDGFVSVKNKYNTRVGGETFRSSLNLKVKHEEDQVAGEGSDMLGMSSHGNKYCSNRENHRVSPYHESFQENSFLPLKRKQNLQQLFEAGFLTKYSEEENSDLFSSKTYRSSAEEQERSLNVLSEMSKCKENLGAEDWRRGDRQCTAGRIKEDQISQEECWFLRCTNGELKENAATSSFVSVKNREITNDDIWNLPPKSTSAMNYKDMAFKNGMIRRATNEHLINGDCISLEKKGNLEGKEEAREGTRRPLADKSNFQAGVVAVAPEIPGKWRCPRRSKPYTGPPLKQLRLERWVHRVT